MIYDFAELAWDFANLVDVMDHKLQCLRKMHRETVHISQLEIVQKPRMVRQELAVKGLSNGRNGIVVTSIGNAVPPTGQAHLIYGRLKAIMKGLDTLNGRFCNNTRYKGSVGTFHG